MADKMLILENGRVFYGGGFGSQKTRIAEIVFNTAMVGYQEILSDPSYFGQIVIMSYPLIGNYGLADDDYESKNIYLSGFVVREYNDNPSNFRFTMSLGNIMEDYDVAGIQDLDTRELVRIIRDEGSMKAMITDASRPYEECLKELRAAKLEENPVKLISTKKVWYSRTRNPAFNVIAVDLGIKTNILRLLNKYGCNVAIVPHNTSKEDIMRLKPDGLLISSGPGGPELLTEAAALIKSVK
ncbi:MAG TPA: carbamoyl phosphate synthase small subunit, partial [Clostridia bacterium]|nr:carbamoyl phosphate synthase small subunit [Clostridia bacterium]